MTGDIPEGVRESARSFAGVIAAFHRADVAGSRTLLDALTEHEKSGHGLYRLCEHLLGELARAMNVSIGSAACSVARRMEFTRQQTKTSMWPAGTSQDAQRAAALLGGEMEHGGQRQLGVEFGTPRVALVAHVVLALSLVEYLAAVRGVPREQVTQEAALFFA